MINDTQKERPMTRMERINALTAERDLATRNMEKWGEW
jgi:hypothetical protein